MSHFLYKDSSKFQDLDLDYILYYVNLMQHIEDQYLSPEKQSIKC